MSIPDNEERLSDWGEFRLIDDIILPTLKPDTRSYVTGDDCAFFRTRSGSFAVTSDVGPKPLVWNLGHQSYFTWGWYSVAINASDIASAGAEPLAFTSSVEAPGSMLVTDFRDFFRGIAAACAGLGFPNAGGNIREAPRFECHGTGIGFVGDGPDLRRSGCTEGDLIVSVGECGRFVTSYARAKANGFSTLSKPEWDLLVAPRPPLGLMLKLRRGGFLTAASDNSDGVLGAIWNIATASKCAVEIDMLDESVPLEIREVATSLGVDPWNMLFCWGDWQVICAVNAQAIEPMTRLAASENIMIQKLGRAVAGPPSIIGRRSGRRAPLNILRNENFSSSSFNRGMESQLEYMLKSTLFRSGGS